MRRTLTALLSAMVIVLATASAGSAGTFQTTAKWKSCETRKAGISVRATFTDPARYHGPGRYKVTKSIRWDVYKGDGKWRQRDSTKSSTEWMRIRNPDYDLVTSIGDRTGWGNIYWSRWRAHVTFTLLKDRRGPVDKKVDRIEIFPKTGSFAEKGHCPDGVTEIG